MDCAADNPSPLSTVFVCITCRRAGESQAAEPLGAALAAATLEAADGTGVRVRKVRCLANCKRGLSAAVRREGGWSYVFGDLDAQLDAPALIAGARLLAAASDGLMPWRERPPALKRGLIARLPPTGYEEVE
jgi:predicted metal-binding protein